jgi:hypothetical protein
MIETIEVLEGAAIATSDTAEQMRLVRLRQRRGQLDLTGFNDAIATHDHLRRSVSVIEIAEGSNSERLSWSPRPHRCMARINRLNLL